MSVLAYARKLFLSFCVSVGLYTDFDHLLLLKSLNYSTIYFFLDVPILSSLRNMPNIFTVTQSNRWNMPPGLLTYVNGKTLGILYIPKHNISIWKLNAPSILLSLHVRRELLLGTVRNLDVFVYLISWLARRPISRSAKTSGCVRGEAPARVLWEKIYMARNLTDWRACSCSSFVRRNVY